ncbi:MAG: hypothetical protein CVU38_12575 [Chloroflexi bacterium HGW-Chloroflexi-1]|nr:MAG: hypothetical protein CVU38_12575 [Chloroflexi bacterium HGW-Chloroflexi-1]
MNILDENIREDQRRLLRSWRIPIHQIGQDVGQKGMADNKIIPFLHQLRRPTFFTRDGDFYEPGLCHAEYCLVYLAVGKDEVASFVRRFLHHSEFDTKAKRIGTIIRLSRAGLSAWRLNAEKETHYHWDQ